MPVTRQRRRSDKSVLLPGIPMDEKRSRGSRASGSSLSRVTKPSAKKGNKRVQDASLPHVALASDLLARGEGLRRPGTLSLHGQVFKPPKVWGHRDAPITDPSMLPKGWSSSETDLAEDDVDGQIERCYRRIDEGIMPDIFRDRLQMYQNIKLRQTDMISSEPRGLSWEVVQRLDCLKKVKTSFDELPLSQRRVRN
ncbi:hypothetical protein DTO027I6_7144 [Penicillium roqueforti]|nr:hypothetical protein LCP963914a_7008 [Penicillium roqueforti]KAI2689617.1 hypothetical protein CBS147355_68 [Penicillium roqueforti]KAI2698279.1 hypothetical protein CBS147372_7297 [Penicillium roqueforti]KAI2711409.1 hypothetical protein CBS147318_8077 [Penicillium roqueforti]KAI2716691.1 hypothetical protein CBS147354_6686 [Penicillium roqueforti]